ncbi:MAG: hypothetical protein ACOC16_01185 [Nanoarchaeota archaeon]
MHKEYYKNLLLIFIITLFSGFCGIAYETLYSKMLSTYFGNIFYIQSAILITFLLSIGIGFLIAHKYIQYFSLIEFLIGIFGFIYIFLFNQEEIIINFISNIQTNTPIILIITIIIILLLPAIFIGFSIPIMTIYLKEYSKESKHKNNFKIIYFIYNFGAAFAIFFIEYLLLRNFGITITVSFIASINILLSILILKLKTPQILKQKNKKKIKINKYISLFLISIASGMFQLLFLKIINIIYGPFNENFSIILILVLSGMAIGSIIQSKINFKFTSYLLIASLIVFSSFIFTKPIIYTWAFLQQSFIIEMNLTWIFKFLSISFISIITFIIFGMSIPLFLRKNVYQKEPGKILAISSFGNCLGFLLITFFLFEKFNYPIIVILISLIVFLSSITYNSKIQFKTIVIYLISLICLSTVLISTWPTNLLEVGYRNYNSIDGINQFYKNFEYSQTYKEFDDSVSIINYKNDSRFLTLNGYHSLSLSNNHNINSFRETLVGISSYIFSNNTNKALVIGLGSGITPGATAEIYNKVTIVDINPAMLNVIKDFQNINYNLSNKSNIDIKIEDGIITIFQTHEKYDLIVNTITSPTYYSASKFWTQNVYNQISKKLNKNGIYVAWFDVNLGIEGMQSMSKTLDESFLNCKYILLNPAYYTTICSNNQLTFNKNINWSQNILNTYLTVLNESNYNYISNKYTLEEFIKELIINPKQSFFQENTPINTFDNQILSFQENFNYKNIELIKYQKNILTTQMTKSNMKQKCEIYKVISQYDVCSYYQIN